MAGLRAQPIGASRTRHSAPQIRDIDSSDVCPAGFCVGGLQFVVFTLPIYAVFGMLGALLGLAFFRRRSRRPRRPLRPSVSARRSSRAANRGRTA